ncbi:MAG: methyl-accepting chemotaxis protein [Chitinispirillales bacterium]|jgi:methyl-accepting chemotaxis protein|nr:methyl-accepting chemotaxis protein [Chitinispirillales bacterium]
MSIRIKIILSIVVTTLLTALVLGLLSISSVKSLTLSAEQKFITESNSTLQGYMKDMESGIERSTSRVANDPDVVTGLAEYLKTGDRKKLKEAVLTIARYSEGNLVTVTDASGIVAMRSHQPEKFGDNNSGFPHMRIALAGQTIVAHESTPTVPVGLRCGVPIVYEGKRIGVVSGGLNLGTEEFVDKMKSFTGAEVTMFLDDTRIMTTVKKADGQRNIGSTAAESIYKQVASGKDYMGTATVSGTHMYTYYSPIRDAANKVIGMTFVGMDITETQTHLKNSITFILVVMVLFCAAAVLIGLYIANGIARPMKATVNMIHEMKNGHLNTRLRLKLNDEVGVMARAMDEFADDLQNVVVRAMKRISVGDLEMMIEPKDDRDEVSDALKNTVKALRKLIIDDGGRVLNATANKDLTQRLKRDYSGAFDKMKIDINTVVNNLDEANGQISVNARNLAEGTSTQASSLEEVSASLEEMSSMTKLNADNSNEAKRLATEARAAADEGDASMKRMAEAINHIKKSADNTAKIVKSINDIAFQTNLLALNAAVEAARAGDAGKGFAVVAGEVRNLAMRSAEAAKNTANMIEESVKNADDGVRITEEVAKTLGLIVSRIIKVGDLIVEIATASSEQAQGIEQVNSAIAQMNNVTQTLSRQASELADMVSAFKLSGGGGRGGQMLALPDKRRQQLALN